MEWREILALIKKITRNQEWEREFWAEKYIVNQFKEQKYERL